MDSSRGQWKNRRSLNISGGHVGADKIDKQRDKERVFGANRNTRKASSPPLENMSGGVGGGRKKRITSL